VVRSYLKSAGGELAVWRCASVVWLLLASASVCNADELPAPAVGDAVPPAPPAPADQPSKPGIFSRWLNPATAPFIPVPLVGSDPNSGTTVGILPVWLKSDDNHEITRIIAPDVLYNPNFGYGADARVYAYSSADEQWSIDSGFNERVQRNFDAEYQVGRLREQRWSLTYSLVYDRSGTPRFYGIGNESSAINETNYTNSQGLAQVQAGLNLNHQWQILYTARLRTVDVGPGSLANVASLESRFGRILGVGTNSQFLNRVSVIYDTRDNIVVPTHGMEFVAYAGDASRHGLLNDSMYSETGFDGRDYLPLTPSSVLASHLAVRYLPDAHRVPFWALSSLGGGDSQIGGEQPLRGYGEGRYYDRNSFDAGLEWRRTVFSFDAVTTRVNVELAPFVDLGRVFSRTSTLPFEQLHHVFGVGFRGIAPPFVVGKVDVGYGSEGVAVFTGLNYPF
jgi:outer membrane protein assembly factor BamA